MVIGKIMPGQEQRWLTLGAALLLSVSLAISGGGATHHFGEFVVKAIACCFILTFLSFLPVKRWRDILNPPILLLGAGLLLLCGQIIPLPSDLWRALPGRDLAAAIADSIGAGTLAHPLSLNPSATARTISALLPAFSVMFLVAVMDWEHRLYLCRVIILLAMASLLLGLIQFLSAGRIGTLYPEGHFGYATGFFANRNHQASFLLLGLALTPVIGIYRPFGSYFAFAAALALSAGIIATSSRAGLVLLSVGFLPLFWMLMRGHRTWLFAIFLSLIAAGAVLASANPMIKLVIARLTDGDLSRFHFWEDSWRALLDYWPAGSGFGTFSLVFQTVEPLDHVGSHYVNHAHNDYLEVLIEGGAPALVILIIGLIWWLWRGTQIAGLKGEQAVIAGAAWIGVTILLLHSFVDYPVRMLAIECVGAVLVAFLVPVSGSVGGLPISSRTRSFAIDRSTLIFRKPQRTTLP